MISQPRVCPCRRDIPIRALSETEWAPAAQLRNRVAQLWDRAIREHGSALNDSDLFSLVGAADPSKSEISGHFIKYRYYVAQSVDPSLQEALKVRPLAVTAIVRCPDGLTIGRRIRTAAKDCDLWELIPAGGIEPDSVLPTGRVDPRLQVRKEMCEEIGVCGIEVASLEPLFWMVEGDVTDLVYTFELGASRADIQDLFARLPTREHAVIDFLPLDRIRHELDHENKIWSASTRALLEALLSNGFG